MFALFSSVTKVSNGTVCMASDVSTIGPKDSTRAASAGNQDGKDTAAIASRDATPSGVRAVVEIHLLASSSRSSSMYFLATSSTPNTLSGVRHMSESYTHLCSCSNHSGSMSDTYTTAAAPCRLSRKLTSKNILENTSDALAYMAFRPRNTFPSGPTLNSTSENVDAFSIIITMRRCLPSFSFGTSYAHEVFGGLQFAQLELVEQEAPVLSTIVARTVLTGVTIPQ
mmetsp:Transcript_19361/g.35075  ORF Transcript_19361/g.35075 Transcript_19361/m.35075 type:complete len:226 (+) Transcript_19361:897-1574(+)